MTEYRVFKKIATNAAWLTLGQTLAQCLNLFCILAAAHFLAPAEYGSYATGLIIIAVTAVVARYGLLEAMVQHPMESERSSFTALMIVLMLSSAALFLSIIVALIITHFIGSSDLLVMMMFLSFSPFLFGLQIVPESVVRRAESFKLLAICKIIASFVAATAFFVSMYIETSIWALVAQRVFYELTALLLLMFVQPMKYEFGWDGAYAKKLAGFSKGMGSANIVEVLGKQVDSIAVRIFWGEHGLGLYSLSKRLLANCQQLLFRAFRQVSIASFAVRSDDFPLIRSLYLKSSSYSIAIGFLAALAIYLALDPVFKLAMSDEWYECIPILGVLCWVLVYESFIVVNPALLQSQRRTTWIFLDRLIYVAFGLVIVSIFVLYEIEEKHLGYIIFLQSFLSLPLSLIFVSKILSWTPILNNVMLLAILSLTAVTLCYLIFDVAAYAFGGSNYFEYGVTAALIISLVALMAFMILRRFNLDK